MEKKYTHKASYYNDIALKLGHQLLGIKYLHYGYFEDTQKVSLESLQIAQEVYAKRLISKIPSEVKTVLDVGCGTGEIARQLVEKGYIVTCVAPDPYLIEKTLENTNNQVKTFTDLYENIVEIEPESIDLILMSESCQYIKPDPGWEQNKKLLKKGGYLLICDFFKVKDIDDPYMSKSGQPLDNFYERARKANFTLLSEEDITANVSPTMTLTQDLIYEKVFPIGEAVIELTRRRYPLIYKIGSYFLKEKLLKLKNKYSALGADKFCYYKKYLTLLFQKN